MHDVALDELNVIFAIDRAGLVGGDGATHQGIYDLAYLRTVPHVGIGMPRDATELRGMLKAAHRLGGPKAIRWPRGSVTPAADTPFEEWPEVEWGSWEVVKGGTDVVVLGIGPTVDYAIAAAADDPRVAVVNARFVKPLDTGLLLRLARSAKAIVTVEDHTVVGGLGSAVLEALSDAGVTTRVVRLGVQDTPVPHGDPVAQHEELGYGPKAIRGALETLGVGRNYLPTFGT